MAWTNPSTLARVSSQVVFVLLISFNNIFNPLFRRVGCFVFHLSGSETKQQIGGTRGKTQRSEGWQGARVGAVSAKKGLVFVLARKRRLDLGTVRAVAERRPPQRSAVKESRAANHSVLDFSVKRRI